MSSHIMQISDNEVTGYLTRSRTKELEEKHKLEKVALEEELKIKNTLDTFIRQSAIRCLEIKYDKFINNHTIPIQNKLPKNIHELLTNATQQHIKEKYTPQYVRDITNLHKTLKTNNHYKADIFSLAELKVLVMTNRNHFTLPGGDYFNDHYIKFLIKGMYGIDITISHESEDYDNDITYGTKYWRLIHIIDQSN